MLSDRLALAILIVPLAAGVISLGGIAYLAAIIVLVVLAAQEYVRLFQQAGHRPARVIVPIGAALLVTSQFRPDARLFGLILTAGVVAALAWHQADFERGQAASGTDLTVTIGGLLYLGWMGSFFVQVRNLDHGLWWTAAIMASVAMADSGAYIVGRRWGRHKMAPRLSPNKTWEGFAGGVAFAVTAGLLLGYLIQALPVPDGPFSPLSGAALGLVVSLVAPIGDLGISMLKRQTGVKDTGTLLSSHGGVLDRIDSWLIAMPVGYYVALAILALWA
jgi:phosphatidate cytidylyltransferase